MCSRYILYLYYILWCRILTERMSLLASLRGRFYWLSMLLHDGMSYALFKEDMLLNMSDEALVFLISSYNFLYLKTKLVIANSLINFLPVAVVWRHRITRSCLVCMKSIRIKVCFVQMIVICYISENDNMSCFTWCLLIYLIGYESIYLCKPFYFCCVLYKTRKEVCPSFVTSGTIYWYLWIGYWCKWSLLAGVCFSHVNSPLLRSSIDMVA